MAGAGYLTQGCDSWNVGCLKGRTALTSGDQGGRTGGLCVVVKAALKDCSGEEVRGRQECREMSARQVIEMLREVEER
jgi:hypothetical protein